MDIAVNNPVEAVIATGDLQVSETKIKKMFQIAVENNQATMVKRYLDHDFVVTGLEQGLVR